MIFRVYSVFDDKSESFMPPFTQTTEGIASRVFSDACRQNDHPFNLNPNDYHLYDLGEFDDATGIFKPSKTRLILSGETVAQAIEQLGLNAPKELAQV